MPVPCSSPTESKWNTGRKKETKYAEKWKVEQANKMADVREGSKGLGGVWGERVGGWESFPLPDPYQIWSEPCTADRQGIIAILMAPLTQWKCWTAAALMHISHSIHKLSRVPHRRIEMFHYWYFLQTFTHSPELNSQTPLARTRCAPCPWKTKRDDRKWPKWVIPSHREWGEYSEFNLSVWWVRPPHFLMSL